MNKVNEISRRTLFYFLIFLPVAVLPFFSSPFELFKSAGAGLIISILGIYFFLKFGNEQVKFPNRFILCYFIFSLVTSIFSINFIDSFFSSYPRFIEGDVLNFSILIFLIILLNSFEKIDVLKIQFYSSIPVSVVAVIEVFFSQQRIHASFSQANFLGIFLAITILNIATNKNLINNKKYKIYFDAYLILVLFLLIKSASITSLLSLLGIFTYLLIKKELVINFKRTLSFFVIFLILFFISGNIFLPKIRDIYFQFKDRNQTTISDSFLIRLALWETTLKLATSEYKCFLLGYGSNTFITEFEKYRNTKLDNYSEYYLFYDKPHNYYLEILFSQGVLMLGLFIFILFRSIKHKTEYSKYILLISIFIFFNWLDWYLKILLFSLISLNLDTEKYTKSKFLSYFFITLNILLGIYYSLILTSDFFYKINNFNTAAKLNPLNNFYFVKSNTLNNGFFYQQSNPLILVEGLKFYKGDDLTNYKKFLENKFPSNLPIKLHLNSN